MVKVCKEKIQDIAPTRAYRDATIELAKNDPRIVDLEAAGAAVHGERGIGAALEKAGGAVGDLRILLDDELEVFLVVLGGRGFHDLVVEVDGCGRAEAADEADLEGLGQADRGFVDRLVGGGGQDVENGHAFGDELEGGAGDATADGEQKLGAGGEKLDCFFPDDFRIGRVGAGEARTFDDFAFGEQLADEGDVERAAEEPDLSCALGLHGLGHAGVERDDRHLKLRADFVDVGFRAKVGDEGHVAALFLKAPGAFKSGDLAVTEGDALRRSVLAQLKFVLDELDGAGRFGCGAEDGGLDERGDDGVDAGHEADLQDLGHVFLL